MTPPARYMPLESASDLAGLKKIFRKVAGPALAVAAVASGNPQLALPAYAAGSSVAGKKKAKVEPPVAPIEPAGGFLDNLVPADRNALMIGGAVVGSLLLAKLMFKR